MGILSGSVSAISESMSTMFRSMSTISGSASTLPPPADPVPGVPVVEAVAAVGRRQAEVPARLHAGHVLDSGTCGRRRSQSQLNRLSFQTFRGDQVAPGLCSLLIFNKI